MNRLPIVLLLSLVLAACAPLGSLLTQSTATQGGGATGSGATGSGASGVLAPSTLRFTGGTQTLMTSESRGLASLLRDEHNQPVTGALTWISLAPEIATVDTNGTVKGLGIGSSTLLVSLKANPAAHTQIEVSVVANNTSIAVQITPASAVLAIGNRVTLLGQVHQADGQINGNIAWTSSDNTVATVNATTGEVNGLKEGRVTIVGAYAADATYKSVADITVVRDKAALPSAAPSAVIFRPGETPGGPGASPGGADAFDGSDGWTRDAVGTDNAVRAIDFIDAQNGLAVGNSGTTLASVNGGASWISLSPPSLGAPQFSDVHMVSARTAYAVAGDRFYTTSDGGGTWNSTYKFQDSAPNPATGPIQLTAIAFPNASTGYVVGNGHVFKTSDGTASWSLLQTPNGRFNSLALRGSKIWLAGLDGIFSFSSASGWLLGTGLPASEGVSQIAFSSATRGWAIYGPGAGAVQTTSDGGLTWTAATGVDPSGKPIDFTQVAPGSRSTGVGVAFADELHGLIIIGSLAYFTADGGKTWKTKNLGPIFAGQIRAFDATNFYVLGYPIGTTLTVIFHYDGR